MQQTATKMRDLPPWMTDNNATLIERGKEPNPGQAGELYKAIFDIIRNQGKHHTRWGFLPWAIVQKLNDYHFSWGGAAYAYIDLPHRPL